MKAEDLLQAMNDIDTKYVAEAQPWTAPVKKLHHPVWAAAAAVMLCLGLGAGAAVLLALCRWVRRSAGTARKEERGYHGQTESSADHPDH